MSPSKKRHVENGRCQNGCGRPLSTRRLCRECADRHNEQTRLKWREYISDGKCRTGCGRELVTKQYCRVCADVKLEKNKTLIASGKCKQGCGRDRVTQTYCRECADKLTLRQHGLSAEVLNAKRIAQDGKCAICEKVSQGTLNVDHHHQEGYVRDLLCPACNRGIGIFKENIYRLVQAAKYLTHHNFHKGSRPFKSRLANT